MKVVEMTCRLLPPPERPDLGPRILLVYQTLKELGVRLPKLD